MHAAFFFPEGGKVWGSVTLSVSKERLTWNFCIKILLTSACTHLYIVQHIHIHLPCPSIHKTHTHTHTLVQYPLQITTCPPYLLLLMVYVSTWVGQSLRLRKYCLWVTTELQGGLHTLVLQTNLVSIVLICSLYGDSRILSAQSAGFGCFSQSVNNKAADWLWWPEHKQMIFYRMIFKPCATIQGVAWSNQSIPHAAEVLGLGLSIWHSCH